MAERDAATEVTVAFVAVADDGTPLNVAWTTEVPAVAPTVTAPVDETVNPPVPPETMAHVAPVLVTSWLRPSEKVAIAVHGTTRPEPAGRQVREAHVTATELTVALLTVMLKSC